MSEYHNPVLLDESISALVESPDGTYADATFGGGGHSRELLSRLSPKGRLIAFDRDSDAASQAPDDPRLRLIHNNFRFIHNYSLLYAPEGFDGILADLGVSSHQFDTAERGFSFRYDAPLDMRMNIQAKQTAADVLNNYGQQELERIFRLYGELENASKVTKLILQAREKKPLETTGELYEALKPVLPAFAEHKFLAKLYQAIRIEVNQEMRSLEKFLQGAVKALKPGGKIAIITYHSLEDRMVKNFFKAGNISGEVEKDSFGRQLAPLRAVNRKPLLPSEEEISQNTRARSAKLRVAVKEA